MSAGEDVPDLLGMATAGGCASKAPPDRMAELLGSLGSFLGRVPASPRQRGKPCEGDAALFEVAPGRLLAVSVDFGTPVSADPHTWGRIATMHALSDLHAVGAAPLFALGLLGWPGAVAEKWASRVLEGAVAALAENDAHLVGGHTMSAPEPWFGLSVAGEVDTDRVMGLDGARPGDVLMLTKPLGTGLVTASRKLAEVDSEAVAEAEAVMLASNRTASRLAVDAGIRTATDVTGYGLVGHACTLLAASAVDARLDRDAVPVLPGALEAWSDNGVVANSAERVLDRWNGRLDWTDTPWWQRLVLADPQTSGGLLLSADAACAARFAAACSAAGQQATVVGHVTRRGAGGLRVTSRGGECR